MIWFFCVVAQLLSCVILFMTPWTVACQVPLSMGFPRQQYWSGLPFPSPGALSEPRMEPTSSWLADSLPLSHQGSPMNWFLKSLQTLLHFPSFSLQWLHPFCAWKTPIALLPQALGHGPPGPLALTPLPPLSLLSSFQRGPHWFPLLGYLWFLYPTVHISSSVRPAISAS